MIPQLKEGRAKEEGYLKQRKNLSKFQRLDLKEQERREMKVMMKKRMNKVQNKMMVLLKREELAKVRLRL